MNDNLISHIKKQMCRLQTLSVDVLLLENTIHLSIYVSYQSQVTLKVWQELSFI